MEEQAPDKALASYFDDLLGAEPEDDASEEEQARQEPSPTPPPIQANSSEPHISSSNQPAKTSPLPKPQQKPEPEPEPAPQIQQRPLPKNKASEEDLALLEEHKRQRLQKMLAQQTAINLSPPAPAPTVVETEVLPAVEEETSVELVEEQATLSDSLLEWGPNGRPLWAQKPFKVLLFEVSGLSLAVPLIALGQIVRMSNKLTFLQGQSEWFMGILPSIVGDIRTINTALFVMPERYQEKFTETAKYVVTIDGLPWGLAVDSVNQPITLEPEDVQWRSERSKRPWIAGTVKSHMCALIDIPQMAEILERSDRKQS